jgi:hypothetical protein
MKVDILQLVIECTNLNSKVVPRTAIERGGVDNVQGVIQDFQVLCSLGRQLGSGRHCKARADFDTKHMA